MLECTLAPTVRVMIKISYQLRLNQIVVVEDNIRDATSTVIRMAQVEMARTI